MEIITLNNTLAYISIGDVELLFERQMFDETVRELSCHGAVENISGQIPPINALHIFSVDL